MARNSEMIRTQNRQGMLVLIYKWTLPSHKFIQKQHPLLHKKSRSIEMR